MPRTLGSQNLFNFYWAAPIIAVLAFITIVGGLLWLLHVRDLEEQQVSLVNDILWVEQSFRFSLERNEEQFQFLARTIGSGELHKKEWERRVNNLLTSNPELNRVIWLGRNRLPQAVFPITPPTQLVKFINSLPNAKERFELAAKLNHPVYSSPYSIVNNEVFFDIYVPIYREKEFAGMIVGIYSMRSLLNHLVPWWFKQRYRFSIIDSNGTPLAVNTNVLVNQPRLSHEVVFDPPGQGLRLRAESYSSGTRLLHNLLIVFVFIASGTVLWSLWFLHRHMKGRALAEQALRTEHAFRKAMEDSMLTGLRVRDLDGRITYVNQAFCNMVGCEPEELIGKKPPMVYWIPEEIEKTQAIFDQMLAGNTPRHGIEIRFRRKNGELFDALIYEAPLIDAEGKHAGWMSSILDITERKKIEELNRQQQEKLQLTSRLVTMGEMASTLAHELNQPLSAIAGYSTGCINMLASDNVNKTELLEAMKKLGAQATRAGKIIRRVHEFVRKNEPHYALYSINEVIEDSIALIESQARERGIRLLLQLDNRLPEVWADKIMLEQVLLNLFRNAFDAMSNVPAERKLLEVHTEKNEEAITVSVIDQGCGISADIMDRLYTPFFTTKAEGMGMGLNICRSIIEAHQGRLWFEPNPNGGSIFCFSLPYSQTDMPSHESLKEQA